MVPITNVEYLYNRTTNSAGKEGGTLESVTQRDYTK